MYGAFIGDIVGSKYEFNNIITKQFPLFSPGCDYTDDTIMTVAVAKAILLSREEQFKRGENGKGFQEFLIEVMQDFGRRYPHPTGAYGGSFAKPEKSQALRKLWKWLCNARLSLWAGSRYDGRGVGIGACQCQRLT